MRWQWLGAIRIEGVGPEPMDVTSEIRTQARQDLGREVITFARQLLEDTSQSLHIVEDHTVRRDVRILHHFALFVAIVFGDHPQTAKEEPLDEMMKGLAFIGGGMDCGS